MNEKLMTFAIISLSLVALVIGGCPSSGDSCSPIAHAGTYCQEGVLYWVDSCGDIEEINQHCGCGCSDDHLNCKLPCGCTPSCAGKCCGDDGCGGTCPNTCGGSQTCNQATCQCEGSCQPQTCINKGYECGTWPNGDGCGGTLECGNCANGEECSASGQCIPVGCPNGQALCDGMCVDSTEDARYCGSCTNTCAAGQVCVNSQCQSAPDCSQTPCVGMAYCDLASGQCLPGCLADNQCPSRDEVCNTYTHDCDCQTGMHRCTGVCYSDSDVNHCGASCQVCQLDPMGSTTCTNGQCQTVCDNDYELCDSGCALCPVWGATDFACSGSACVATACNGAYELCNGACAACPSTGVSSTGCQGDNCIATACNNGYELCNGDCSACPTTGVTSTACSGDACVATGCQTGYSICDGECSMCPSGTNVTETACQGNQCVATECILGYYPDGGDCVAWVSEDVDMGSGIGWGAQVELGTDDMPQIAHCDEGNRDLKFSKIVSGSWSPEGVDETDNVGIMPSLALDNQNRPHVIYYDLTYDRLKYARFDGSSWIIEPVTSSGGSFVKSSMALDSSQQPHVCFFDASDDSFYYIKRTSSGWGNRVLIETMDWIYNSDVPCSLAVGSDNQPRVLYRAWDATALKLATYSGSSWQKDTLHSQESIVMTRSLVLDAANVPHIFYFNSNSNRLVYAYKSGTQWDYSTVAQNLYLDEYSGVFQLRLDSSNQPHVIWDDYGLRYAYLSGDTWFRSVISDENTDNASFDLDSSDHPHFVMDVGYGYSTLEYWH